VANRIYFFESTPRSNSVRACLNSLDLRPGAPVCKRELDNGVDASINLTGAFKSKPVAFHDGQF